MSLDRSIVRAGLSGLSSASDYNKFAQHVNTLWNTKAGPGLKLTKGEPWLLEYTAVGGDAPITTWFNDTCIRVYVWRDDAWDYGSDSPPLAFFVSGAFTTLNEISTLRLAKVVKGSTGASARATAFCDRMDWTAQTAFFTKNKDNTEQLFIGSQGGNSYEGGPNYYAHLLNWETGEQDANWTGANCTFPAMGMVGIASVAGRLLIHDYFTLLSLNLSGVVQNTHVRSGEMNMHALLNDGVNAYLTCAWVSAGGYSGNLEPQGLRKLNANGAQNGAWVAASGVGSECGCFFGTLPNFELWDAGDTNIYVGSDLLYGDALKWNGVEFGFNNEQKDGGIMKVSSFGAAAGIPLGIATTGQHIQAFCKSPANELWFGYSIGLLETASQPAFNTATFQLYKYNESTDTATYFDGFNDLVIDCQYFSTVEGVQQFIVVGAFTTYQGEPAERIVFIDQDGNRLADLIWPDY